MFFSLFVYIARCFVYRPLECDWQIELDHCPYRKKSSDWSISVHLLLECLPFLYVVLWQIGELCCMKKVVIHFGQGQTLKH